MRNPLAFFSVRARPARSCASAVRLWLAATVLLLVARPLLAVIKVDLPLAKMYQSAKVVAAGTICEVDGAGRLVRVTAGEPVKGHLGTAGFILHLVEPADAMADVRVGQPVVLVLGQPAGGSDALVHLADRWLLARSAGGADLPLWWSVQQYDGARSFPGRTAALARIFADLKAGRQAIQDWVSHEAFLGGVYKLADLKVRRPRFMTAIDLDDDGDLDLLVGDADGLHVFQPTGQGYDDATQAWGLERAVARCCAAGDASGDAKADLFLGDALWVRHGDRFVAAGSRLSVPADASVVAAALADVTGDGRADANVLLADGRLVTLENPGSADGPWKQSVRSIGGGRPVAAAVFSTDYGDDGRLYAIVISEGQILRYAAGPGDAPPDDFRRLTGVPLSTYDRLGAHPMKVLLACGIDYDGTGKDDFIVVTDGGGITLANRGYGAFLVNGFLHQQFRPASPIKLPRLPVEPAAGAVVAPGRRVLMGKGPRLRQNLLVLSPDGQLFEMDNTPRR